MTVRELRLYKKIFGDVPLVALVAVLKFIAEMGLQLREISKEQSNGI